VALDPIQIRFLRGLAHDLNPIVMIGQKGMSDGVRVELDDALSRHELVKIRVVAEEREDRDQIIQALVRDTRSELIQKVGHTATFYRRAKKPKLVLPGEKPAKREDGFGERPSRDGQRPFRARRNEVGGGYGERPQRASDPADTRVRRSEPRPPRREGGKYAKPPARGAGGGFSKRPPRAEDIVGAAPRRERSFGGRADGPTHRPARPARDFGDRPARPARPGGNFADRPKRDFGDRPARPARDFADRPKRDFGDRPARPSGNFADRPKRDFGDRPARPSGNFADRPKRDFGDRPARPNRDLGAKPAYKPTGARPSKPAGKPSGSPYKPLGTKRPKREADED
jgi:putative YhbY family RNA-binding protein